MASVALTAAIMDMCHQGHINLLDRMRKRADVTVVVLHSDESCWRIKRKVPVQHIDVRVRNLEITGLVDHVLVTHLDDPANQFSVAWNLYPHHDWVFIRGDDNLNFPGRHWVDAMAMPIEFAPYTDGVSSTYLREVLR